MRCHVCNSILQPEHISWNSDHQDWDPCPKCLIEIEEVFSDPLDEDEITRLLEIEGILSDEGEISSEDEFLT